MKYIEMKKWVKALRSGKFKQGRGMLENFSGDEPTYCCLGVLCKINNIPISPEQQALDPNNKLSLKTCYGTFPKSYKAGSSRLNSLDMLNDEGLSFKQIALIIERNYKDL